MELEKIKNPFQITVLSSDAEKERRLAFSELFQNAPLPDAELLTQLGLFMKRQTLSRVLFLRDLYAQILDVHGVIFDLGTRWGQNMALFQNFRGIYEPHNLNRKIIGFDTFSGFPSVDEKDGALKAGEFSVATGYEHYLEKILAYHESESPISHIRKHEVVKGNAVETVPAYLKKHPETLVAFAYFDFDLYEPTKACLEALAPHVTKGTVIGFDELNVEQFPGETLAFKEVFGANRFEVKRSPISALQSYVIIR